jgi:hypothetical protein
MYPEKRAYKRFDSNLFISYSLLNEMGNPGTRRHDNGPQYQSQWHYD